MSVTFCLYDLQTGAIKNTGICDPSTLEQQVQNPGQGVLQITSPCFPRDWYIDVTANPPTPILRPEFSGAIDKTAIRPDGLDAAVLSGLPNPSTVTIIGIMRRDVTTVTDGNFRITSTAAGRLSVYVDGFPEKLFQTTVTAA